MSNCCNGKGCKECNPALDDGNKPVEKESAEPEKVQIKMNRKQKRKAGMRARTPWSAQVDSFLCLLNHKKYVANKESGQNE